MGLFRSGQSSNLKATIKMVEGVLGDIGLEPSENRLEGDECAWGVMKGSAEVFIFVKPGADDEDANHIVVVSPLIKLPQSNDNQLALFRFTLGLNAEELSGVAFGVRDGTLVLTIDRSTTDLDPSEVKSMILRVGYYADIYDDVLVNEFGGARHSDAGLSH